MVFETEVSPNIWILQLACYGKLVVSFLLFSKCLFATSVFLFRKFERATLSSYLFSICIQQLRFCFLTIICNFVLDIIAFVLAVFPLSSSELASFRDVYFSFLFLIHSGKFLWLKFMDIFLIYDFGPNLGNKWDFLKVFYGRSWFSYFFLHMMHQWLFLRFCRGGEFWQLEIAGVKLLLVISSVCFGRN